MRALKTHLEEVTLSWNLAEGEFVRGRKRGRHLTQEEQQCRVLKGPGVLGNIGLS